MIIYDYIENYNYECFFYYKMSRQDPFQYSWIPGFKNEISRKSYVKILSGLNSSNNLVLISNKEIHKPGG